MTAKPIDKLAINTIRTLAMDAVQAANSGHPGTPMAMAPVAYCLWQEFLRFDPSDPIWPNRDRFVLSMGRASTLLYSLLHLSEVKAVNPKYETLGEAAVNPLLPYNLSNYLYGVTKIGFWPYLAASWAGMLPGTFLYVYLGAAGKEATSGNDAGPWKWVLFGAGLVATVVVTVWISRLAKKAVPEKQ